MSDAFWSRVDASRGVGGCWPWTGARSADNYGRCRHEGRPMDAHRVAFILARGPIAPGLVVMHQCRFVSVSTIGDVIADRRCCSPAHLRLGDQAANARDRERVKRLGRPARVNPDRKFWL